MSVHGHLVIDSDLHVMEPWDLWLNYLPEKWRHRAPIGSREPRAISLQPDGAFPSPSRATWPLDYAMEWGRVLTEHMAPTMDDYRFALDDEWSPEVHLSAMDQEGIDIGVMFPSRGLFVMGFDVGSGPGCIEPDFATALARAYNDWLHDFMAVDRRRMYGAAMVAPHDIDGAVTETRRAVEELGFKTIFLLPGVVGGREWHHPDYDPLWRTCQDLDIPVSFHGGGVDHLTDFGVGHSQHLMMWHTFSHCVGPMSALVSFCAGGVLDRFPTLRAAFLEANCSWAPWLLHRLDEQYDEYVGRFERKLNRLPSEAFVENCYVAVEADEKPATLYVQTFGDDNVVFSTDFPHPDSKFPNAVEAFLNGPLDPQAKRKFLWDNCARLYRISAPATVS